MARKPAPPKPAPPEVPAPPEPAAEPEPEAPPARLVEQGGLLHAEVRGVGAVRFKLAAARPSYTWDMVRAFRRNPSLVQAAAIGHLWFGADRPAAAGQPYTNALEWGAAVADELLLAGWPPTEIEAIGDELVVLAIARLPKFSKLEEGADPLG